MPDFDATITDGAELAPWSDPETDDLPSRINPHPQHDHLYWVVPVPGAVEVSAIVDGVAAPMDVDLDSRLFTWAWTEWTGPWAPSISTGAGQSSLASFTLTADHLGHFALNILREDGGAIVLHLDGVPA